MDKIRVCVIGCGAAGLAAGRHLLSAPDLFEFVIYEQTSQIGGTWVYTDRTGTDEYGLPVHTSMYRNLRTNLPKEIMGFPDYPIPKIDGSDRSYLTSNEILGFLQTYANNFGILSNVKFLHHVKTVEPEIKDDKLVWKVTVLDLPAKKEKTTYFHAVMACNGHYHTPDIPHIKGEETFLGEKCHSHDYRNPSQFKGKSVVVVGAGPSGIDLTLDIASVAKRVILSKHRHAADIKNVFPSNVTMKYEISEIKSNSVIFEDGSIDEIDTIFYCTGYKYSFPFLSEKCGITVVDNCVQPLYKHLINAKYPTLCLVGLPYYVCAFSLFDLQVRFFIKTLTGEITLPSEEEMKADTTAEMEFRRKQGLQTKQFHRMGEMQGDYYSDLARLGKLEELPKVLTDLHNFASQQQLNNLVSFREDNYKIIDSTFVKVN